MYDTKNDRSFRINFKLRRAQTIEGTDFEVFISSLLRLPEAAWCNYSNPLQSDRDRKEAGQDAECLPLQVVPVKALNILWLSLMLKGFDPFHGRYIQARKRPGDVSSVFFFSLEQWKHFAAVTFRQHPELCAVKPPVCCSTTANWLIGPNWKLLVLVVNVCCKAL